MDYFVISMGVLRTPGEICCSDCFCLCSEEGSFLVVQNLSVPSGISSCPLCLVRPVNLRITSTCKRRLLELHQN